MSLADRLRGVVGPPKAGTHDRYTDDRGDRLQPARVPDDVADILGGTWHEGRGHRYLVVDTKYSPGHRHGSVAVADCLPAAGGIWPMLPLLAGAEAPALQASGRGRLLFVDLETTGLAGGAGTYAFLVGCGWFEPPSPSAGQDASFRVRQYFLAAHTAERALLEAVAEAASGAHAVVTYNGKSFDLPLIETRFLFHRMETPFAGVPHVDMLHPARRLWREDGEECRLARIEAVLLGHVRDGDVPGFEIPGRYFHYVRTSDARPLCAVLEHNRLDLLALAMLTARAAQLLDEGPAAARTAREALGLGRLYERAGRLADARACYAKAAEGDAVVRPEALRGYAVLCRRERLYEEAAAAWQHVLDQRRCPPRIAREAHEALAVHLEHRARDLRAARKYALQSLQFGISRARAEAVQYRLARLDRKLGAQLGLLGS